MYVNRWNQLTNQNAGCPFVQRSEGEIVFLFRGKTVILTDDGATTGSSMLAAIQLVKSESPENYRCDSGGS